MSVSFTSTIKYNNPSIGNKLFNKIEDFFNLSGRKVIVFDKGNNLGVESQSKKSFWKTAAKILAYSTVIIPLIMLTAKAIGRAINQKVSLNQAEGLDWAIDNNKEKLFGKILKATNLKDKQVDGDKVSNYIYEKDNVENFKFINNQFPHFIEYAFLGAINKNSKKIIKYLLDNHHELRPLPFHFEGAFKRTLERIINEEKIEPLKTILNIQNDVDAALEIAIKGKKTTTLEYLAGSSPGEINKGHLLLAAKSGNVETMNILLSKDVLKTKKHALANYFSDALTYAEYNDHQIKALINTKINEFMKV